MRFAQLLRSLPQPFVLSLAMALVVPLMGAPMSEALAQAPAHAPTTGEAAPAKKKIRRKVARKKGKRMIRRKQLGDPVVARAEHTRVSIRKTSRVIRSANAQVSAGAGPGKAELAEALRTQLAAHKAYAAGRYGVASHLTFTARRGAWAAAIVSGVPVAAPAPDEALAIYPEVGVDEPLHPSGDEKPEAEGGALITAEPLPAAVDDAALDGLDKLDGALKVPAPTMAIQRKLPVKVMPKAAPETAAPEKVEPAPKP